MNKFGAEREDIPTVKVDPYERRDKCKTCMWGVFKEKTNGAITSVGRCRKRAPTMNGYPTIFTNDWCGGHKVDENKI